MNTLGLDVVMGVGSLCAGVVGGRHWRDALWPRVALVTAIAVCGGLIVFYFGMALYLIIHPTDIEPLDAVMSGQSGWFIYAFLIPWILFTLASIFVPWCVFVLVSWAAPLRSLLQRVRQQR